jgi:hypothetical protein
MRKPMLRRRRPWLAYLEDGMIDARHGLERGVGINEPDKTSQRWLADDRSSVGPKLQRDPVGRPS